jgi:hypothetical protein
MRNSRSSIRRREEEKEKKQQHLKELHYFHEEGTVAAG